ncbi:hypothetical protein GCM10010174_40990 [Kutzneria viridogrisea]|uniref:Uncharacterized protein n=1 Tax=Kutzneria viridogrisea TaxID=47990 RepID=A0ABR6BMA0_9PSEU|nr:hypothetical protein [Kutzneria viridogrisea]
MRLRSKFLGRELADRWGLLMGVASAGAAWAVQLPVAAIAGVGVGVWLLRAGFGALQGRSPKSELGAVEEGWLRRAARAAENFSSAAAELPAGPATAQVGGLREQVDQTVATLRRLAEQSATTARALRRIDEPALLAERDRLLLAANGTPEIAQEVQRSLDSVHTQLAVGARLTSARAKVLAQLESGTLGLESLVARVAELSATSTEPLLAGGAVLQDLGDSLEGIRRGVVETAETTARSLGELR